MDCFNQLVNLKFLRGIDNTLSIARDTLNRKHLKYGSMVGMYYNKKLRKQRYDAYLDFYGFSAEFDNFDPNDRFLLYYMHEDNILLISTRSPKVLNMTMTRNLLMSGDIPFYKGKQYIQNKLFYMAMYDLDFRMEPPTLN